MKFGWINFFGAAIVILMLIPNVIYAFRNRGEGSSCSNRLVVVLEQIGRFACMILMWLPLLVWEFGFSSVEVMMVYLVGNAVLLFVYWIIFASYMKQRSKAKAIVLAILPMCIFLLSGLILWHWLLVGAAVLFGIGHILVTIQSYRLQ